MSKEIYISSTPHETRLAIVEKDELTEIYYERENEYTLAGSIYNGRVTRVLPGMQSSFVDIGLERDAFLYITDFMEEAGDSADFESGEARPNNGRRSNGGGEGRGRREERGRGSRRDGAAQPADQRAGGQGAGGQGEELDAAPGEWEQGDRGEYDLGGGGPGDAVQGEGERGDGGLQEGTAGADGSKRWRGRRGRRRGRGGNEDQRDIARSSSESGGEPAADSGSEHGVAEAAEEGFAQHEAQAEAPHGEGQQGRGGRGREGGRERGGRGRGGRDAGRESGRDSGRESFAPRGGRGGSGGSREEEAVDLNASADLLILPGESLSRYKRGAEPEADASRDAAASSEKFVSPKPATEVVPLAGWDGGSTLPGETLSRHRGAETRGGESRSGETRGGGQRSESRNEGGRERSQGGSGRDRRRERDEQRGRGESRGRAEGSGQQAGEGPTSFSGGPRQSLDPAEAVLPAVTSQHDVDAVTTPFDSVEPTVGTHVFEQEEQVEERAEAAQEELLERGPDAPTSKEFEETAAEFEPGEEASAAYRVEPNGPSEFRWKRSPKPPQDDLAEVAFEDVEAHETAPQTASEEAHEETAAPEHEFTSVQATGEMVSEAAPAGQEGKYAPGDGEFEEELMDEEDGDVPHLHASAMHEDMEEETLEGAADLATMLREMSIDQITRPEEPAVEMDEEDGFDIDEEEIDHDQFEGEEEISGSDVSEAEEDEFAEAGSFEEDANGEPAVDGEARPASRAAGEGQRRGRGGDGRRDGRRGGRERGGREGQREGFARESGSREGGSREGGSRDKRGMGNSRSGGRNGRHSMQSTDLPAITDLLKPGQELLVQIAKEPIAKKGARITSHIALPGRFLVFMPTVGHVGVSRKIESDAERRRLKEILLSERGEASGGFIVRTAAAGASEEELRSDLRFLLNLWVDIKQRSESSKSPALIYHDLNLVERILRDQVTDNFSAIWVDTETEYERVLRFLQRFQPSLIRRVKLYSKETPLFEQFGISEEINKALRAKVWLKSGGSIVINQTEALVAIDINTGKFVGKTARLEDTILKTNLDAIPEIVRQIRLRDLGGIIIIDFIDMDERKNRNRVMAALEEELKSDRAPSKVLQFNDFGLVAITRKRVKQSLERTLSTTCGVCAGTGMVKSPVTVCNDIYIEMRKMHKHLDKGDIMLRVNPEVVKQLKNGGGKWLQEMEEMSGKTILVKSDPALHPEQFDIH